MTFFNYVDNLLYGFQEKYTNYNIADEIVEKIDNVVEKIENKLDEKYEKGDEI